MEKWWAFSFSAYSALSLYLSEDSNSHRSFPSAPLEAATFTEKQKKLLRHSKAQSKKSYTEDILIGDTFR